MYWCCAQTEPKREAAATHFLGLAGYEVYCPRLRLVRPRRGRKIVSQPPLFPGYAFLVVEAQWYAARWSAGVIGMIMDGTHPARVADSVIADIRKRERNGLVELAPPPGFRRGDPVRITCGIFAGQLALFEGRRPHQRVAILLAWLGAQRRIDLPRDAISSP